MATDEKVSDAVKLNAIRDALDRAGLKPGIEVEATTKPVYQIIDQIGAMQGGSREAFRRGIADGTDRESDQDTPALAVSAEPVDAEVVEDFAVYAPLRNQRDRGYTVNPRWRRLATSATHSAGNRRRRRLTRPVRHQRSAYRRDDDARRRVRRPN